MDEMVIFQTTTFWDILYLGWYTVFKSRRLWADLAAHEICVSKYAVHSEAVKHERYEVVAKQ
jgi:hypothetical protein